MNDKPWLLTATTPNLYTNQRVRNGTVCHYRKAIIHLYDGFTGIKSCSQTFWIATYAIVQVHHLCTPCNMSQPEKALSSKSSDKSRYKVRAYLIKYNCKNSLEDLSVTAYWQVLHVAKIIHWWMLAAIIRQGIYCPVLVTRHEAWIGMKVCYIWPVSSISISLAHNGMSSRHVAVLVLLCSIHMSKLLKWTKLWCDWKLFQVWGMHGGQIFASRKNESWWDSSQVSDYIQHECLQQEGGVCVVKQIKDGWKALNDGLYKQRSKPRALCSDKNWITVKDVIGEDRRVKVHEIAQALFMKLSQM
jgi:hypothetical protein